MKTIIQKRRCFLEKVFNKKIQTREMTREWRLRFNTICIKWCGSIFE